MKRLPNLDVLRFVLATLVLMFHLPQLSRNQGLPYFDDLPIFHRGIEAVYMFFVLSGFLIIRLIYNEKLRGVFSIKKFYMRRILRIFPLYYLIVAFGFVFYQLILPILGIPFENNYNLVEGILLCVFFMPNVFGSLYEPGGILEILWSIGIEEQFYLLIAPLMFFIKPKRIFAVLVLLTVLYFVVFHTNGFEFLKRYKLVYFLVFVGGITAILEIKLYLEFLKQSILLPLLIVILTILYFTTDILLFETSWLQNLVTSVLFSLFIHTLAHNNCGIEIKHKTINYFGTISYGIYMFHAIALNFVVFLFLKMEFVSKLQDTLVVLLINILTFAITILFAHFSYTNFESYFLQLKQKFRE
ncbi:MAG: acyltransferase [Flavobacteriaceae bacterium]|nr:acyltransferase [Flavobacteriaceae bacterium]